MCCDGKKVESSVKPGLVLAVLGPGQLLVNVGGQSVRASGTARPQQQVTVAQIGDAWRVV